MIAWKFPSKDDDVNFPTLNVAASAERCETVVKA